MKLIKRLIIVIVLLIVVGVVAGSFYIDSIAKTGVERGASYAMEVDTTLDSADVRVLAGGFTMNTLDIKNPQGYKADHFLRLGKGDMSISLGTLMEDTVEVPTLHLDDLSMVVEKQGDKSNLDVIMASIGRLSSGEPAAEGGKRYVVREIIIRNVTVKVIMPPVSTDANPLIVNVPEIRLKDVGSDSPNGVVLSQLTGTIVTATLRTVVENAPDVLGNLVVASLDTALAKAGDIGKVGTEVIGKATEVGAEAVKVVGDVAKEGEKIIEGGTKALEEIGKGADPGKALEDVTKGIGESGKKLEEGVGGALRGIGNLVPGKKEEEKKEE